MTDCVAAAALLSPAFTIALALIWASVVELTAVVATTPATPTAPPATPIGAKLISSLVTAATLRPLTVSVVKLASTNVISRFSAVPS